MVSAGHEPTICIPKIARASAISSANDRKPVNSAVIP
jgi:hypothetical protein